MGGRWSDARAIARAVAIAIVATSTSLLLPAFTTSGRGEASQPYSSNSLVTPPTGIANISDFLEKCPTNDARYLQIRADFEIRKEGSVVGDISCSEPVSAMPIAQYTDELIVVQALRTIYYMEGGRTVPYPWTSGSFYDWMKTKIGGIDIRANGSYCCENYEGKWFIVVNSQGDNARNSARKWLGISDRISLIGHETRHVDGYPHVGGCPLFPNLSYGCDQTYNESNLSPYGFQWWLNAKWLSGELNVGYSCLSSTDSTIIANGHLNAANNDYGRRFVDISPPRLAMSQQPGGPCLSPTATGTQTPSPTRTPSPTPTPSPSPTRTPSPTPTPSPSPTPTPTSSPTPSPTPTSSPTPSPTPTSSPTPSPTPTSSPTPSPTPTPTPKSSPTPSPTPTSSPTLAPTPTPSHTPSPGPTRTPTPAPTPTHTVTPSPSPSPSPVELVQGDIDCSGGITSLDALNTLRFLAGLTGRRSGACPDIGDDSASLWGDVDCSGGITSVDALKMLRYVVGLSVSQNEPCPDLGAKVP